MFREAEPGSESIEGWDLASVVMLIVVLFADQETQVRVWLDTGDRVPDSITGGIWMTFR
jgi:hypothetical protein